MRRSAARLSGLAGVVAFAVAAVGLPHAHAAAASRKVSVPGPAAGKITVAVVRFHNTHAGRPVWLRPPRRGSNGGPSAFVAGTARLRGGGRLGLVAIVNFRGNLSQSAAARTVAANRAFTVDFVGDAEAYRGRLAAALRRTARRGWRVDALELPPRSVDRSYRSPRILLDEVRRLLVRRPDAAFLAALRGPQAPPALPLPVPPPPSPPPAPGPRARGLTPLSSDPFTNASSAHRTQVEPDSFAFGSTVVAAFQSGRFYDGGASGIGFARSGDAGRSWTNGFLPALTKNEGNGPFDRASDPTVAYDARHGVWLIASLGIQQAALPDGAAVVVSRSADGGTTWSAPVTVATGVNLDKEWVVCDNHPASAFYGRCYIEWDGVAAGEAVEMSTSMDGGASWSSPQAPAGGPKGFAGQPLVQPNGRVVVVFDNADSTALLAFASTDGGATWSAAETVASISDHEVAGGIRTEPIPSAEIDGSGTIYVVWQDCRFRIGCASNDLVMTSTTQSGYPSWSPVRRIPIDPTAGTVDHFIPGLAVDPATSGAGAHLGLTYYYLPNASCTLSTCELDVGFVSSADAGATWTAPAEIAGPMRLSWLPPTTGGIMVGDYISTSYADGEALPFFALANAPGADGSPDEAIYTW
jgi:BNR repeat-like domain